MDDLQIVNVFEHFAAKIFGGGTLWLFRWTLALSRSFHSEWKIRCTTFECDWRWPQYLVSVAEVNLPCLGIDCCKP